MHYKNLTTEELENKLVELTLAIKELQARYVWLLPARKEELRNLKALRKAVRDEYASRWTQADFFGVIE